MINKIKISRLPYLNSSLTFNVKGSLFVVTLLIYALFMVVYLMSEKSALLREFDQYEKLVIKENKLIKADLTLDEVREDLLIISAHAGKPQLTSRIQKQFELMLSSLTELSVLFPEYSVQFNLAVAELSQTSLSPTVQNLHNLENSLSNNKVNFENILQMLRQDREQKINDYYHHSDSAAMVGMIAGGAAIVLFGGATILFFRRITRHIQILRKRIFHIMRGDREQPLIISRSDELGELINGVNAMAAKLDEHEKELELAHYKSRYQEKMLTTENLAAGLVHEIGNPAAAIVGLCRELLDDCQCDNKAYVKQIEDYGKKLIFLGDDLAKLAMPQQKELGLVNVNELIQNACSHTRFDERWQSIELKMTLAHDLPAIKGYQDQLSLMLLHLLSHAFDRLKLIKQNNRQIIVETSKYAQNQIQITIGDSNSDMLGSRSALSIESDFTTNNKTQENGLGLSLCQSIIKAHSGSIKLCSCPGEGSKVSVILPSQQY